MGQMMIKLGSKFERNPRQWHGNCDFILSIFSVTYINHIRSSWIIQIFVLIVASFW